MSAAELTTFLGHGLEWMVKCYFILLTSAPLIIAVMLSIYVVLTLLTWVCQVINFVAVRAHSISSTWLKRFSEKATHPSIRRVIGIRYDFIPQLPTGLFPKEVTRFEQACGPQTIYWS